MLCYRCGSHVPDGSEACSACGQRFDANLRGKTGTFQRRKLSELESAGVKIGELLAERYEVRSIVGQGPVGAVLRALDREVDVEIGLKLISPRLLQSPEERAEFSKLVKQAKKLSHPNIVRVYEIGTLDAEGAPAQRPFFTMQLLDGLTLRRVIDLRREKNQLFVLREVEPILAQVALALEHAQQFGPHGDLKPDNVIVLPDLLKVTDFGLALGIPRAPFVAAQKGRKTDVYLAPEFLGGRSIDARADVYSMGVILGEMLAGVLPQGGQLPELRATNPDLPPAVEQLYRRCVGQSPDTRFAQASDLAAELLALSETTAPPLPKASLPSAPPAPRRTRPPPPPAPSGSFEIKTELDEPAPRPPSTPPGPPVLEKRTAKKEITKKERPAPRTETTPSSARTPKRTPSANSPPARPASAEPTPAGSLRWIWIALPVLTVIVVALVYGFGVVMVNWKAQMTEQIRHDLEQKQAAALAALAADAGHPTIDAGAPVVAVVADAGPAPELVTAPPTAPTGPEKVGGTSGAPPPTKPDEPRVAETGENPKKHATPAVPAEPHGSGCPAGMHLIEAGGFRLGTPASDDLGNFGDRSERRVSLHAYCIDQYEFPNKSEESPTVGTSYSAAEAACSGQGKRLCSEEEWEKACKGPRNLRFPYGQSFDPSSCNGGGKGGGVRPAGSYGGCRSGFGVFDMSGNVSEWTSTRFQAGTADRAVKGGYFGAPDYDLRCSARQNKSPGSRSGQLGFRCCGDPR